MVRKMVLGAMIALAMLLTGCTTDGCNCAADVAELFVHVEGLNGVSEAQTRLLTEMIQTLQLHEASIEQLTELLETAGTAIGQLNVVMDTLARRTGLIR